MIFQSEASLQTLISNVADEIAALKRFKRLITLSQETEDIETVYLLLECYESNFNCFIEEIEWSLEHAQRKAKQLPEDLR